MHVFCINVYKNIAFFYKNLKNINAPVNSTVLPGKSTSESYIHTYIVHRQTHTYECINDSGVVVGDHWLDRSEILYMAHCIRRALQTLIHTHTHTHS